MKTIALRLKPDSDVRQAIEDFAKKERINAAVVLSAVGSLSHTCLRFAGQDSSTKITGKQEILTLSGMLSEAGVHLHIAIADSQGNCTGGHLTYGCQVYTTLEIAIALLPNTKFDRVTDETTGFKELEVSTFE